jgi:SOS response regulatory protein OraA/RecX
MNATNPMSDPVTITKMKPGTGRYFVTLSNRSEPLSISEMLVFQYRLKEGIVITPAQLEQLEIEADLAECDRVAARLLTMREQSIGELRVKLTRRGFRPDSVKGTVKRYVDNGLLDDHHYAQNLGNSLLSRNPAGRGYLIAYLQHRLISREIAELTADMLLGDQDELELAVKSLERRWSTLGQFDLERARSKAYTYLSRRGISYSAAKAAFDRLWNRSEKDGND